jgi:hypothetical protein
MTDFDWDQAIDKARSNWSTGAIKWPDGGGECAIGILASAMGVNTTPLMTTAKAIEYVIARHPEVVSALYATVQEQEPSNEDWVTMNVEDQADYLTQWNDHYCPSGERLATYLEKARVR